jgi:hypothetical protein
VSLPNHATARPTQSAGEAEPSGFDLTDRPVVASINMLSAAILEILRPFVWQSLILLYLLAQFGSR